LAAAGAAAADVQVTAELNPTKFAEDQAARLTVTVTGVRSASPEMPVVKGLRFRYLGQNQQTSWVNGDVSTSIGFNFTVQAEKPGEYTIGSIKVTAKNKIYTTRPVTCTVHPVKNSSGQAAGSAQNRTPAAGLRSDEAKDVGLMRIIPETERIYSGQLVPFTLKAYFQSGRQVTLKSTPRFSGEHFLLHSLDEEPRQRQERFNGELYTALTWQGTLSAVKEGTVPLIGEMDAEIMVRAQSRRRSDPFGSSLLNDPFFGDIFGRYSRREVKITSPEKSITVLDLPAENRPDDFNGAIGTFSLAVAASPLAGKVGDPITLKMKLTGSGNFDMVRAPELSESEGWKVYPASDNFTEQGGGKGEKTFEQAVVPTQGGLTAVPQLEFSYFDPIAADYVTLTSDPIPLALETVEESVASAPVTENVQTEEQKVEAGDSEDSAQQAVRRNRLAPLRTELGALVPTIRPLYQKIWFQLLMALALLCLLAALLLYLRRRKLENDPSILRRKQVKNQLTEHYQAMETAITVRNQESFRHHCRGAIQQRTGEAWGLAPEAITLADLAQRLAEDAPLRGIFSRLEQSGYAGEHLAQADLEEILQTTRNELDKLV
jgi:hypothetical protein